MGKGYYAGIDSGSTSTDVVILNKDRKIISSVIMPTERVRQMALKEPWMKLLNRLILQEKIWMQL